jgi:hypothetical protein
VGTTSDKIPPYLRWVQGVSIIRWAFEALCVNEFEGLAFEMENPKPLAKLLPGLPKTIQISGQDVRRSCPCPDDRQTHTHTKQGPTPTPTIVPRVSKSHYAQAGRVADMPPTPLPLRVPVLQVLDKLDMPACCSVQRALGAQLSIMTGNYLLTYLGLRFKAPRFQPLLPPPAAQPLANAQLPLALVR